MSTSTLISFSLASYPAFAPELRSFCARCMSLSEGPETLPEQTPSLSLKCAFFHSRLRELFISQGLKLETQESLQFLSPHTLVLLTLNFHGHRTFTLCHPQCEVLGTPKKEKTYFSVLLKRSLRANKGHRRNQ